MSTQLRHTLARAHTHRSLYTPVQTTIALAATTNVRILLQKREKDESLYKWFWNLLLSLQLSMSVRACVGAHTHTARDRENESV